MTFSSIIEKKKMTKNKASEVAHTNVLFQVFGIGIIFYKWFRNCCIIIFKTVVSGIHIKVI